MNYKVIYLIISENLIIHRNMNQKDLGYLLLQDDIELISVNEEKTSYRRKKKVI